MTRRLVAAAAAVLMLASPAIAFAQASPSAGGSTATLSDTVPKKAAKKAAPAHKAKKAKKTAAPAAAK